MTNDKKEQIFKWTSRKRDVAKHLAEGLLKQNDIANLCECTTAQISVWKHSPEFMDQIADYILVDARATKAGILQAALKGVRLKEADMEADKSTHLDYLKAVADIQGHNKKTLAIEGEITTTNKEVVVVAGDAKSRALVNELLGRMEEQKNG